MKKVYIYLCLLFIVHQGRAQSCTCSACTEGIGTVNISNDNDVTVGKGSWMAAVNGQYFRFKMPDMAKVDDLVGTPTNVALRDAYALTTALRYGVSNRLAVSVVLPYVHIQAAEHDWSSNGVSDMMLLGDYHVSGDGIERIKFTAMAGIKFPTGDSDPFAQEIPIALSSGSYDLMFGAGLAKKAGKITVRANALYRVSTEGYNGIYFGNFFTYNLIVSFQPGEKSNNMEDTLGNGNNNSSPLVLYTGLSGEEITPQVSDHVNLPNTGSYYLYAKAGIVFNFSRNISVPVAFELPVYKSLNGMQNEVTCRISAGLSCKF